MPGIKLFQVELKLENVVLIINGLFANKDEETLITFSRHVSSKIIWNHIESQCPTPTHPDISFVDWFEKSKRIRVCITKNIL